MIGHKPGEVLLKQIQPARNRYLKCKKNPPKSVREIKIQWKKMKNKYEMKICGNRNLNGQNTCTNMQPK